MYSDLYTKLSVDERKVLENYHKKQALSKQSTPKSSTHKSPPASTQNRSSSIKSSTLSKATSSKTLKSKTLKRTLSKTSVLSKTNTISNRNIAKKEDPDNKANIKYEVERLLRALYRLSVTCPEFKQELKQMGGISLLDEYLKYRELKSLD